MNEYSHDRTVDLRAYNTAVAFFDSGSILHRDNDFSLKYKEYNVTHCQYQLSPLYRNNFIY